MGVRCYSQMTLKRSLRRSDQSIKASYKRHVRKGWYCFKGWGVCKILITELRGWKADSEGLILKAEDLHK